MPTSKPRRTKAAPKSRLFIVDDHAIARFGLAQLINTQPHLMVCGEADSAQAALKLIPQLNPDLVIADITLRDGNGLELIRALTARHEAVTDPVHARSQWCRVGPVTAWRPSF